MRVLSSWNLGGETYIKQVVFQIKQNYGNWEEWKLWGVLKASDRIWASLGGLEGCLSSKWKVWWRGKEDNKELIWSLEY